MLSSNRMFGGCCCNKCTGAMSERGPLPWMWHMVKKKMVWWVHARSTDWFRQSYYENRRQNRERTTPQPYLQVMVENRRDMRMQVGHALANLFQNGDFWTEIQDEFTLQIGVEWSLVQQFRNNVAQALVDTYAQKPQDIGAVVCVCVCACVRAPLVQLIQCHSAIAQQTTNRGEQCEIHKNFKNY